MLYVTIYSCPTYDCFINDMYFCKSIGILYLSPQTNVNYMVKSIPTILYYKL